MMNAEIILEGEGQENSRPPAEHYVEAETPKL